MSKKKKFRLLLFAVMLFLAVVYTASAIRREFSYFRDIPLISQEDLARYTEDLPMDFSMLRFENVPVAVDYNSATVYISQSADDIQSFDTLRGAISCDIPGYRLFFTEDAALWAMGANGSPPLTLVVADASACCKIKLVVTPLPVVSMDGQISHGDDKGRAVMKGNMSLFSGADPSSGHMKIDSFSLEWHLRGATSSKQDKKPWKLSIKDPYGENLGCEMLGMGYDDDWILNPMNMDDTKLREKLMMDLWNEHLYSLAGGYKMSCGEYVELLINGEYQGLYLLQRRVDEKYLNINKAEDMIFKGTSIAYQGEIYENYDLVYSPLDAAASYGILQDVLFSTDGPAVNFRNFLTTNLYLQFFCSFDNISIKNTFYILRAGEYGYELYLLPWDTDMSMGLYWNGEAFSYAYTLSFLYLPQRMEFDSLENLSSQLDSLSKSLWEEMKEAFSPDLIEEVATELGSYLDESGALVRDLEKWGTQYGDEDTREALIGWCKDRFVYMGACYR